MSTATKINENSTLRPAIAESKGSAEDVRFPIDGRGAISVSRRVIDGDEGVFGDFVSQSVVLHATEGIVHDSRVDTRVYALGDDTVSLSVEVIDRESFDRSTSTVFVSVKDAVALRDALNNAIAEAERGA